MTSIFESDIEKFVIELLQNQGLEYPLKKEYAHAHGI